MVQLVEDDAQGALAAALEHFAELARVLDDATAKAIKLDDTGMNPIARLWIKLITLLSYLQ